MTTLAETAHPSASGSYLHKYSTSVPERTVPVGASYSMEPPAMFLKFAVRTLVRILTVSFAV